MFGLQVMHALVLKTKLISLHFGPTLLLFRTFPAKFIGITSTVFVQCIPIREIVFAS